MNIVIGSSAQWAAATGRILQLGQMGYDTTADVLKVGDGATGWASLPAVGAGGGAAWGTISGTISSQTDLAEYIRDIVAAFVVAGSNVTVTHNDGADTLTIAASGGGGGNPAMGWVI